MMICYPFLQNLKILFYEALFYLVLFYEACFFIKQSTYI